MYWFRPRVLIALLMLTAMFGCASATDRQSFDVVVYGGTPGGITASIAASREGARVVLLEPTGHVGGMSTNGLNRDESEHMHRDETFGGLANRFFDEAASRSGANTKRKPRVWHSRVAEQVFVEMLAEAGVMVRYEQRVDSVSKSGATIDTLRATDGTVYGGAVFIDASYEGDLLAAAGVSYSTGRESREKYGESLAGVNFADEPIEVSPFDEAGRLLPGVMQGPMPEAGDKSEHPTPYNIRMNLTTRSERRVEITEPANYDPNQHELLARCIEAGMFKTVGQIIGRYGMPGGKVELNNRQQAIVSLSMPGEQTAWAEASYDERDAIYQRYINYTHGMLWFLKTDPRVPQSMRDDMARYALCEDEWADNGHWPWQLYVREGRRMLGRYVLTQNDVDEKQKKEDVIHLASHFIDSHHTARYAVDEKSFINEGRIWQAGKIYDVPYRAITPIQSECDNLLVPVCVSASHVAFCSIRVEASWMMLGEAAGVAAAMAVDSETAVQSISVPILQERLKALGIPLD